MDKREKVVRALVTEAEYNRLLEQAGHEPLSSYARRLLVGELDTGFKAPEYGGISEVAAKTPKNRKSLELVEKQPAAEPVEVPQYPALRQSSRPNHFCKAHHVMGCVACHPA
jgi:hypothetical protein